MVNGPLTKLMLLACVTVTSAASMLLPVMPQAPVDLGSAGDFALLTKSGITSTGATMVGGDIGTSPIAATAITGFALTNSTGEFATSAHVNGKVYAASYALSAGMLTTAISDMETAYTDAAGRTPSDTVEFSAGLIGNTTLTGGVHKWSTVVTVPVGQKLYFDAAGDPDTVWIMQISHRDSTSWPIRR